MAGAGTLKEFIMTKKLQILAGAAAAIAVVIGLYFLNTRWIAPATSHKVKAAGNYPMAPDFSLTDLNGAKLALSDYKGKVVLLDFWATWCGPCRIEIPSFVQMETKYRDRGFTVIGLAIEDTPDAVQQFYKQFHMDYPVAMGDTKVASLYGGILGLPTSFVIGRDGRIYSQHTGTTSPDVFEREIQELLAQEPGRAASNFTPAGNTEEIELGTPGEANSEVPGVDISKLKPEEVAQFKKQLDQDHCTCGCKFSVLQCRRDDTTCSTSRKMARDALDKFTAEKSKAPAPAVSKT
jgi:thiol-disulfide isomerase/thioredoxin